MWKPILDGTLRKEALAAVNAVGSELLCETPGSNFRRLASGSAANFHQRKVDGSLATGAAGLAIFYTYLSRAQGGYETVALELLKKAGAAVSSTRMNRSFFQGFTGVAWTIAHLREWLLDPDDNSTAGIDRLLLTLLSKSPWKASYDLVSGLVGFGVYALEQVPKARAIRCLEAVICRLDEIAEHKTHGTTWLRAPHFLPIVHRNECPQGYYDLGLAHGVPGVIAFLGYVQSLSRKLSQLGSTRHKVRGLLEGAVSWLLDQRFVREVRSVFPYWTGPGVTLRPSRVGWCYGDLGIAVSLLNGASALNNRRWRVEALALAKNVARRPVSYSQVVDSSLCHGAAGVAHLFNRMYQATGENFLRDAAREWFERTLAMRRKSSSVAGFFVMARKGKAPPRPVAESGLLGGAAGVGLALLAATTTIEPAWDRMLLVSVPPSRGPRRSARPGRRA